MPSYKISLLSEAREDIISATDYLNLQRSQLGNKFFIEVAEVIDMLQNNPLVFQKKYKNFRQASIKKYSFLIHYLVDEQKQNVIIFAVLHTSQNPLIWKKRGDEI